MYVFMQVIFYTGLKCTCKFLIIVVIIVVTYRRALRLYVMLHFRSESPSDISESERQTLKVLQEVFLCLNYAHSAVNFLLYVSCGSNFRRSLHQLVTSQVKHLVEWQRRRRRRWWWWWCIGRGGGSSNSGSGGEVASV